MPSEFPVVPLGELCEPDRGITYGIVKGGDFVPNGVPVIRGGDIRDGRIEVDHAKLVTMEVSNQFRRTILKGGEIVINLIAEPGHTAIVPMELAGYNVSRDVAVISLNSSVNHRFVDYALKSPQCISWLTGRLQGSVTQKINLSTLRDFPVPIPSREVQEWIASVLGGLDDKIELNRRMNETLEAMARALFQNWFVDATQAGLPKGWEVRGLDEIANFLNGLALQKFPPNGDKSLPVIKIAQLRAGHTESADRCGTNFPPQYIIEDGDVLFSWSGSLEVEIWCGGRGALNQHLFKVTSAHFPKWFYYLWTRYHLADFQNTAANKATTMGHIQRHHLREAKVFVPPPALMETMNKQFAPLLDKLIANRLETRTLATLRDALLPKLLSGELRVPAAMCKLEARA